MNERETVESCRECGKSDEANYMEPTRSEMLHENLCFLCLHWTELWVKREQGDERGFVTKDFGHFQVGDERASSVPKHCLGFGGSRATVRFKDGREAKTNNLWHQGTVPEHFRDRLSPNAALEWE